MAKFECFQCGASGRRGSGGQIPIGAGDAILALDLGTRCGWALARQDGSITSGEWRLANRRGEGPGRRFLRFRAALIEIGRGCAIRRVAFEDIMFGGGGQTQIAAQLYGGWKALLLTWCETHRIPYVGLHSLTLKKFATGYGRAGKGDIIAAMRALGHDPGSDNEADALALLHWLIDRERRGA